MARGGNIQDYGSLGKSAGSLPGNSPPPPVGGLDSDAQAYIDAMSSAPDAARQTIINQFFLDIKGIGDFGTDDIFSQLDFAHLFAAHAEQAALLDIRRAFDATAVNAPAFEVDRGFTGASTKYIETNFVPSSDGVNFTKDDCSFGGYSRTDQNAQVALIGAAHTAPSTSITELRPRISGSAQGTVNAASSAAFVTANALGFWVGRRTASNAQQLYRNGSEVGTSAGASVALPTFSIYALARNVNDSADRFFTGQVTFIFAGAALTTTEQTNLFNAVETYMDAVGAGVVA